MPKKIKSVKKLRSSKTKSHGMTDVSKQELLDILHDEKWAELQPRIDLTNALIKIEELEEQIDNPDYYNDRGNNYPMELHTQLAEPMLASDNAEMMINEINAIASFFIGMATMLCSIGAFVFILIILGSIP